MKNDSFYVHPSIRKIIEELGLDVKSSAKDNSQMKELFSRLSDLVSEIELDRDLLESSLKLASDEMQDHYFQLAQSAKMASLGEMAGNVAHEINNPLQILMANIHSLAKIFKADHSQESVKTQQRLGTMELHVHRIAKIISGLKTISRDGSQDNFSETDLNTTIIETLSICKARIKDKGIELRLPEDIPSLTFMSRASQISQVLINLLINACDAIELAPTPPIEKWIELKIDLLNDAIKFQVWDSGPGVPIAIEQKIMKPFYTTKPIGKGTGLGLSVSSAIAKDHGGFLTLDRSVSDSCFVFQIAINVDEQKNFKKAA